MLTRRAATKCVLRRLPGNLFIEDFLHHQWDDAGVVGYEEAVYLAQGHWLL